MTHRKLIATNFLAEAGTKARVRTDGLSTGVRRVDHRGMISESRGALKHAVASARLESVSVTGGVALEAVREAMKPVRAHFDKESASRRSA